MIDEDMILAQRRRPHRGGLIPKGRLHKMREEREAKEQREREAAASEQRKVNDVTNDVVIEPTASTFFECEPDTYYDAIVREITSIPNKFPDARSDTQLQWDFEVVGMVNNDEEQTQAYKRAWSSPTWNPRAKMYKWAMAILGTVDKDATFRTSTLINQPCRIVLQSGVDDKGNPTLVLNVAAPVKAAVKKSPLAARLQSGDVPPGVTVAETPEELGPCVLCDEPGDQYNSNGKIICAKCA